MATPFYHEDAKNTKTSKNIKSKFSHRGTETQ